MDILVPFFYTNSRELIIGDVKENSELNITCYSIRKRFDVIPLFMLLHKIGSSSIKDRPSKLFTRRLWRIRLIRYFIDPKKLSEKSSFEIE